ncbi:MAG: Sec-independent protein translocase protein TatB [Alphaproteobacteria bacterium]|nr:Sec-independent protein translocase protein TatB [Alphaproteobacteria bacterium]
MLDFGWAELLIIVAVAIFVIGPKDIPNIMYGVGRFMRRFQYIRFAVSQQFDEIMKVGDIEELRKGVNMEVMRTEEQMQNEIEEDQELAKSIEANSSERSE